MNYYEILGIDKNSNNREVKKAYARKLRQYNLECNKDEYISVLEAYEVLRDNTKRLQYDKYILSTEEKMNLRLKEQAKRCLENGDFILGLRVFKKLVMLEPKNQKNLYLLVQCYCGVDNFNSAKKILQRIIRSSLFTEVSFVLEVINSVIHLSNYYLVYECAEILKVKVEPFINREKDSLEIINTFAILQDKIRDCGFNYEYNYCYHVGKCIGSESYEVN